jgi:hypothetical protein
MDIINLNQFPENIDYAYGQISELDEYDIEDLKHKNIDIAVYWYACGSYEGQGQLLFHSVNGWNLKDLGHCSCYGPIEGIESDVGFSLDRLYASCSHDVKKEVGILFDRARKQFSYI